jgi:hypothetical protein
MARGTSRASSEAPATPVGEKLGTNSITPPKNIPKGKVLIGVPLPDGSIEYSMSTKAYPYVIVGKYPEKGQSGETDYGDKHGKWAVAGMVGDREKAQKFLLTQKGKRNPDVDMRIVEPTYKRREDDAGSRASSEAESSPDKVASGVVGSNTTRMNEVARTIMRLGKESPSRQKAIDEYKRLRDEAVQARNGMKDKEWRKLANFELRTVIKPYDNTGATIPLD